MGILGVPPSLSLSCSLSSLSLSQYLILTATYSLPVCPSLHSCFPSHSLSVTPSLLSSSCDLVCCAQQLADLSPHLRCLGGDPARLGTWSYGGDGSAAQQPEGTEARHPQPSPSLPDQGSGQMGGFVLSGCRSVEISRVSLLQWSKDLCLFFLPLLCLLFLL